MNKVEVLQRCRLFENLLPQELEMIGELCVLRRYKADEKVFAKGDIGESLHVIVEGEVDVLDHDEKGNPQVMATLAAPDFFGEMSLIDKEYRNATVRARGEAALLSLSNENLHSFAKVYREGFTWVAVNIARVLSQRLRDTNGRLVQALSAAKG